MFSINPTQTKAWKQLKKNHTTISKQSIKSLFDEDNKRAEKFSAFDEDIILDFSKNKLSQNTLKLFKQLSDECKLYDNIKNVFSGNPVNKTENRAVLHFALRNSQKDKFFIDNKDVKPQVDKVLKKIKNFCDNIHNHKYLGYTNKKITTFVNIGIGGSDLGPKMVVETLKTFWIKGVQSFFVSNIDETDIQEVLKQINPEETIFIIASKTFTTQETLTNATTAKTWFLNHAKNPTHIKKHFIALSINKTEVEKFGIDENNMFEFWDWVGGRYSLWSAIGISIALTIGYKNFENLLKGAEHTDQNLITQKPLKNISFLLALIGIWHRNFFNYNALCVLPYYQYLQYFPRYLQQTDMESNGKYIDRNNKAIDYQTSPVIWGEPGTNSQHSFFQFLHQGTNITPCDFILSATSYHPNEDHNKKLFSNCLAQSSALMIGKTKQEVIAELKLKNINQTQVNMLANYKTFKGDRPSNTILLKEVNPYNLGKLIALYENKTLIQGLIWNVYSFDQFGVELGKEMCSKILPFMNKKTPTKNFDSSTNQLINLYKRFIDKK